MNLRTMIAVLATATTGIVLLTAASHAQGTDLNASAATAPKARSDTAHPASAAKRKPDSSAAPSDRVPHHRRGCQRGQGAAWHGSGQRQVTAAFHRNFASQQAAHSNYLRKCFLILR